MSRLLLVIGICVGMVGRVVAAPAGLAITAHDSASGLDEAGRAANAALITHELDLQLARIACTDCHVDASLARLSVDTLHGDTTVTATINIAISDDRGVMIAVLSGGARAVIPNATTLTSKRLAALRAEALTAAVDGMGSKITAVLHRPSHHVRAWLANLIGWFSSSRDVPTS